MEPIQLYYWPTPNGKKITIFMEEAWLPYEIVPVNIWAGDQYESDFLKISPNNKIPAIVDPEGPGGEPISLFESGSILMYLAEKTGLLLPESPRERYHVLQWLMFQMGHVGPMLGQAHHFRRYSPEKIPYAIDRYTNEAARLYGVMDDHLARYEFFADDYSIADIAIFPWLRSHDVQGQDMDDFPDLKRWYDAMNRRPAVQRGLKVGEELRRPPEEWDEESRAIFFGNRRPGRADPAVSPDHHGRRETRHERRGVRRSV